MVFGRDFLAVLLYCLATFATAKPIMVSFGTNQGPIVPRQPKAASVQHRTTVPAPAPVSENREDVPNPNQYKPLVPHQYRSKIFAYRPPTNLILGTPLDQKNTPSLEKHNLQKKENAKELALGVDYTGPHMFEKQDYEIFEAKKHLLQQQQLKYQKPYYFKQIEKANLQLEVPKTTTPPRYVPQIGVVYLSGVRYYIPQLTYYTQEDAQNPDEINSVYDNHDVKYSH